jgi:hypothetical protein
MTTRGSSPATDEMGETPEAAHVEAVYVLGIASPRRRVAWAPVGTPNCCREHAEQNL